MSNFKSHIFSVIISPLSLIPFGIALFIGSFIFSDAASVDDVWVLSWVVGMGIVISYVVIILFGLPVALILQKIDGFRYRYITIMSLIPSSIVGFILQHKNADFILLLYSSGIIVSCSYKKVFDSLHFNSD